MDELDAYVLEVDLMLSRAREAGDEALLRMSIDALLANPKNRIKQYNGQIYGYREDEMVVKLLTNKKEQYEDYNLDRFIAETQTFFHIKDRAPLKGGKREIFFLTPK